VFRSPALQKHKMFSFWFTELTHELGALYCNSFHTHVCRIKAFSKVIKNRYETRLYPCHRGFHQKLILYSLSKGRYLTPFVETEDSLSCHHSPPQASIRRRIHCTQPHHITSHLRLFWILSSNQFFDLPSVLFKIWNYNLCVWSAQFSEPNPL
jgi:hypothetical protein